MAKLTLTLDQVGTVSRAAVWQGRDLINLFRSDRASDLEGAVVNARLVRILKGEKAGFCEGGLSQPVYVEKIDDHKTGNQLTLKITGNPRHGKAYAAKLAKTQHPELPIGIVTPPPEPWQRAIQHTRPDNIETLFCADAAALSLCAAAIPDMVSIMRLDPAVSAELDQICDTLTRSRVPLKCGAELVIEPTEALTAIDVNLGNASHALTANLEALREAARQIRLRDIRGMIVIDALRLSGRTDQAKLLNVLKTAVANDWRKVHVFGFTKLGLVELTRTVA